MRTCSNKGEIKNKKVHRETRCPNLWWRCCNGMYLPFVFTAKSTPLPLSTFFWHELKPSLMCLLIHWHIECFPSKHCEYPINFLSLLHVESITYTVTLLMILLLAWTNSFLALLSNCIVCCLIYFFVFPVKSCPALVKPLNTSTHASYRHSITAVIPFQNGVRRPLIPIPHNIVF